MKSRPIIKRNFCEFKMGDRVVEKILNTWLAHNIMIVKIIKGNDVQFVECQGQCWHNKTLYKKVDGVKTS